jgi:hypothetical protein
MWFMAVQTGEDVAAGLTFGIGVPEIIIIGIIAGSPAPMHFGGPVKGVKISAALGTVNGI